MILVAALASTAAADPLVVTPDAPVLASRLEPGTTIVVTYTSSAPLTGATVVATARDNDPAWRATSPFDAALDARGIALAVRERCCDDAATYSVWIDARAGTQVARVHVDLVHPPGALRVAPAAIILATTAWLPSLPPDPPLGVVVLAETTGKTDVAVRGTDTEIARRDGDPARVRVSIAAYVPASGRTAAVLVVNDPTTLATGTTTGALELDSRQLVAPATITYEIHATLKVATIVLAILAGLVFGLGGKAVLRVAARQRAVRLGDAEIATALARARACTNDPTTLATLKIIDTARKIALAARPWARAAAGRMRAREDELRRAAPADKVPEDPLSVASLIARVQAALAALGSRIEAARQEAQALANAVTPDYALPARLAGNVASMRAAVATARQRLLDGAPDDAHAAVANAVGAAPTLLDNARGWGVDVERIATELELRSDADRWPAPARATAATVAAEIRALAGTLTAITGATDAHAIRKLLEAVHAVAHALAGAARRLAQAWTVALDGTGVAMMPPDNVDPTVYLDGMPARARALAPHFPAPPAAAAPALESTVRAVAALVPAPPAAPAMTVAPLDTMPGAIERMRPWSALATSAVSVVAMAIALVVLYAHAPLASWAELAGVLAQAASVDVGLDAAAASLKSIFKL